ncbi:MAG: hypothetical protein ACRDMV_12275 [Streptosporangiales bacterium]
MRLARDDRFGKVIGNAAVPPYMDLVQPWLDNVTIGAPGKNSGAGAVVAGLPGGDSTPRLWKQQDPHAGDGYGSALGKKN